MLSLQVQPMWGDDITSAIVECIKIAAQLNCGVELTFNGRKLLVYPDSLVEDIVHRYNWLTKRS